MPAPSSQDYAPAGLPCPNSTASFWHSEPNPFLLGHRTTPTLPETADIVIVGTGITGASVARYLTEDHRTTDLSILLLEAREVCWGATGRNGGHCQPLLTERPPNIGAFEIKNLTAVRSYIESNNVDCEWRLGSACRAFFSKELFEEGKKDVEQLRKTAPELGKLVTVIEDKKVLAKHRVSRKAHGATLTKGAAGLWPYKLIAHIVEKVVREGKLNLQTNTPVTKIESQVLAAGVSDVPIVHVTTPRGVVAAKHVILATNGYTSHLLPSFAQLIVPARCEMSALQPPENCERLPSSYGFVGKRVSDDDYLIQRPYYTDAEGRRRGGHFMFGGGLPHAQYPRLGVSDDDVVDQGEATYLRGKLLEYLDLGTDDGPEREKGELKASHQWTGIKGFSRDNMPWVGKVPEYEGVWLAGGYTGHGMPNGTLCGRAVAQMVLSHLFPASSQTSLQSLESTTRNLIVAGDLPEQYVLTPERVERAIKMPSVAMLEQEGAGRPLADRHLPDRTSEDSYIDVAAKNAVDVEQLHDSQQRRCLVM